MADSGDEVITLALGSDADTQTVDILQRWESVLTRLERDPMECARELDWVAKLKLLQQYRDRDGLEWDHPKLRLIDLQYHDVQRSKGLYWKLASSGKVETMHTRASGSICASKVRVRSDGI